MAAYESFTSFSYEFNDLVWRCIRGLNNVSSYSPSSSSSSSSSTLTRRATRDRSTNGCENSDCWNSDSGTGIFEAERLKH